MRTKFVGIIFASVFLLAVSVSDSFSASMLRQLNKILLTGSTRQGGILKSGSELNSFLEIYLNDNTKMLEFNFKQSISNLNLKIKDLNANTYVYQATVNIAASSGGTQYVNISGYGPSEYEIYMSDSSGTSVFGNFYLE